MIPHRHRHDDRVLADLARRFAAVSVNVGSTVDGKEFAVLGGPIWGLTEQEKAALKRARKP